MQYFRVILSLKSVRSKDLKKNIAKPKEEISSNAKKSKEKIKMKIYSYIKIGSFYNEYEIYLSIVEPYYVKYKVA